MKEREISSKNITMNILEIFKGMINTILNKSASTKFNSWIFLIGSFIMCRYLYGDPEGAIWEFTKTPQWSYWAFIIIAWLYCQITANEMNKLPSMEKIDLKLYQGSWKDSFWIFMLIELIISLNINPACK